MSMEPNITSARGYISLSDNNIDKLKDINLFSTAELLTPIGITSDDSIRSSINVVASYSDI